MTWFKVDDSFYDHPKVFDAPDCAVALWTRAGCWSARNLTDGFVPANLPARLCDDPDTAVKDLVRRGLWMRASGGYRFHDWNAYQPSADDVRDLRAKRAAAGRRGGQAKAARGKVGNETVTTSDSAPRDDSVAKREPDPATSGNKQNAGNRVASASDVAKQNAAPSRPVPKGRGGTGKSLKGTSVTRADQAPPGRCPDHLDDPSPPPCGPCADARRERETWERGRATQAGAHQSGRARTAAEAARAAIDACPQCDHRGYLGAAVCAHDPDTATRTSRGAAAARAALRAVPDRTA